MKKIFRITALVLTLCCLLPQVALAQNEEYINTFDTRADAYSLTRSDCQIAYTDSALKFISNLEYPPLSKAILPYVSSGDEYIYSCEFSLDEILSPGSFFGLVFGKNQGGEIILSLKKSGVGELSHVTENDSTWEKLCSFSFGGLDLGVKYTVSVVTKDSYVFVYFGEKIVAEAHIQVPVTKEFGICGRGVKASVEKLSVSDKLPIIKSVSQSYDSEIYKTESNVDYAPFIVCDDSFSADTEQKVQSVMFKTFARDGVLYTECAGQTLSLSQRVELYRKKAILGFYVSDEQSAALLIEYLDKEAIYDAYIFSPIVSILKTSLDSEPYRRGVLDMTNASFITPKNIADTLYQAGIRSVVISEKTADFETVYALRSRFITVFVKAEETKRSVFNAIASGADGIITSRGDETETVLKSLEKDTVCRAPIIMVKTENAKDALEISESSYGGAYVECELKNGQLFSGEDYISDIYEILKTSSKVLLCKINDKESAKALSQFCKNVSGEGSIFALCPADVAKYIKENEKGIYAHVDNISSVYRGVMDNVALFELETKLGELNSVFFTSSEHSDELVLNLQYRGVGVYSLDEKKNGQLGFITSDAKKYGKGVMYLSENEKKITAHYFDGKVEDVTEKIEFSSLLDAKDSVYATGVFDSKRALSKAFVNKEEVKAPVKDSNENKITSFVSEHMSAFVIAVSAVVVVAGLFGYVILTARHKEKEDEE